MYGTRHVLDTAPDGTKVCAICGTDCGGVGRRVSGGITFHPKEVKMAARNQFVVETRVFENGFLVHTPGDEISMERAVELGLVEADKPKTDPRETKPSKAKNAVDEPEAETR